MQPVDRVILSWPKNLTDVSEVQPAGKNRSWVQLARTGQFKSKRYGTFSITKDDLAMMMSNFQNVTPKNPTELPIDYDHLSMDPKKVGDGIAAGWMKKLELRENGEELWAEVEWTVDGADRISKQEYRFVSPSFVKDHTHKDGTKIGTTLLAAAITNHPFLEGMKALTLSATGELTVEGTGEMAVETVNLSEIGQRVMIAPGNARTADEIGATFEIVEVVGDGDNAFVVIADVNGVKHKWFRATELLPASATPPAVPPNLVPGTPGAVLPGQPPGAVPPGVPPVDPAAVADTPPAVAEPAVAAAACLAAIAAGNPDAAAAALATAADPEAAAAIATTQDPSQAEAIATALKAALALKTKNEERVAPDSKTPQNVSNKTPVAKVGLKGIANMTFKLRNDKNEEIEFTTEQVKEQLEAAGIKVVPDGSTVIPTTELTDLRGSVTNLSTRVESMAAETAAANKRARKLELTTELKRLKSKALITGDQEAFALAAWGETDDDLTQFKAWAATFKNPILKLDTEHGSGDDATQVPGQAAEQKIISLANQMVVDRKIPLRDAVILASAQLAEESEAYREQYRPN